MDKPGLARAIPAAILGFLGGSLLVLAIRALQQMDPVWDPQVALVVTPFIMTYTFIWGMGGFDPRMSQHAHPPGEHEHDDAHDSALATVDDHAHDHAEEEATPFGILMSQIWRVATYTILVLVIMFGIATLPLGLTLRTVNEDVANVAAIETNQTFDWPLGLGSFEASQLVVFIGLIIVVMVSLLAIGGLIGLLFHAGHQGIAEVKDRPATPQERRPPLPVRVVGNALARFARNVRRGMPGFFGQK